MRVATKTIEAGSNVARESVPVRAATLQDLDALVALEQRSFDGDRLSRAQYRRHLHSASAQVMIAGAPGQIRGSAVVFFRRNSALSRLYSLAVQPEFRGSGIGVALVAAVSAAAVQRGCRALRLEVRCENTAAIQLYQRHGFVPIGRMEAYYEDGADALRYELALDRG